MVFNTIELKAMGSNVVVCLFACCCNYGGTIIHANDSG